MTDDGTSSAGPAGTASSPLTDQDLYLFNEGTHCRLYGKLGAHPRTLDGVEGVFFAVWAPNAESVSVIGDFNDWNSSRNALSPRGESGVWETFVPRAGRGSRYKYHIVSRLEGHTGDKADPFAFHSETPPKTASIVWDLEYAWGDAAWMSGRRGRSDLKAPISVYEAHLGSWKRLTDENNRALSYREHAEQFTDHVKSLGFTHVELLPIMEHPFFGSWGYQTTGYFCPTSRYGTPQDFMYLVDRLHQEEIGVILDWVPSHFPNDGHGLGFFDGTYLFEHSDPKRGYQPDWNSLIFNYGRKEVAAFLISSALFWLDKYHADAIRVDAVASMLYRDYSRKEGEWEPNEHGGRENLEAIDFLRNMNRAIYEHYPDVQTIAEESTAWPMVSRPVHLGGLGFGMKWDMGWMNDTLEYMQLDPIHRKFHQDKLTFRGVYAGSENFLLPLSHDEVVHGKRSLVSQMPGDVSQKFAGLRALLGYMYALPGKKLLFMGSEIGPWSEWDHERGLPWHLLEQDAHAGLSRWVEDLNRLYRKVRALSELDFDPAGFEWIDCHDLDNSVLSFLRKGGDASPPVLVVCNFTPVARHDYRIGVPSAGRWTELLNSGAERYGGSGEGNPGGVLADKLTCHDREHSVVLTLPPLSVMFLENEAAGDRVKSRPAPGAKRKGEPPAGAGVKAKPAPGAKRKGEPPAGPGVKAKPAPGAKRKAEPPAGARVKAKPASGAKRKAEPPAGARVKVKPASGAKRKAEPPAGASVKARPASGAKRKSEPPAGARVKAKPASGAKRKGGPPTGTTGPAGAGD